MGTGNSATQLVISETISHVTHRQNKISNTVTQAAGIYVDKCIKLS